MFVILCYCWWRYFCDDRYVVDLVLNRGVMLESFGCYEEVVVDYEVVFFV